MTGLLRMLKNFSKEMREVIPHILLGMLCGLFCVASAVALVKYLQWSA